MVYNTFNLDIIPKIILEVGTHGGGEALSLQEKYKNAIIYTYEADISKHQRIENNLKNSKINFCKIGLGKEESEVPFYKFIGYENDGADSLFPRYNGQMKKVYNVKIDTLKNQMKKKNIEFIDLLCLDTQGSEYNILLGLEEKLNNVKNIILEIPDIKCDTSFFKIPKGKDSVYEGAGNSYEIISLLKNFGFVEVERKKENDLEANVLFTNTNFNKKYKIKNIKKEFDCVLTAINNNEDYLQYIPNYIKSWKYLFPEIDIKIILINDKIPDVYSEFSQYITLFLPIDKQDTAFTAQNIRIYYPSIINSGGCLITDIDIFPMNRKYYIQKKVVDNLKDKFIIFRNQGATSIEQEAICYNMASSEIWQKLNNCYNEEDIKKALIKSYPSNYGEYMPKPLDWLKYGWFKDQEELYNLIKKSKIENIRLGDKLFNRIDKINLTIEKVENLKKDIINKKFSDFIPCRKDNKNYKEINNLVINYLINE
jgi:FkbM family methyltransferase